MVASWAVRGSARRGGVSFPLTAPDSLTQPCVQDWVWDQVWGWVWDQVWVWGRVWF